MTNTLYYGDNLMVMREYMADESVDLVYLDPPFNSNRDYNVLFKEQSGDSSAAQIKAFTDTWKWSERAWHDFATECPTPQLVDLMNGFINTLGRNDVTAYLVMMAPRLVELRRVLKPTGSLYLHCDPTASHYLKLVLDTIFDPRNFRNEIVWKRTNVHNDSKTWSRVSDTIFFYTKTSTFTWNTIYEPHSEELVTSKYRYDDGDGRAYTLSDMTSPSPRPNMMYEWKGHQYPKNGWRYSYETMTNLDDEGRIWYPDDKSKRPRLKRYLDDMPGTLMGNVWTDLPPLNSQAAERLGYPTQKPVALLKRILEASSNEGDVVFDPFCGCGTSIAAAQEMKRRWIGIDITHLAVGLIKYRLADSCGLKEGRDYVVVGEPTSTDGARALALQDRDEFQKWAVGLVDRARAAQDKKGADGGLDGVLYFNDDNKEMKKAVLQVKSGKLGVSLIRDFLHVMQREKSAIGLFISLDEPTAPMLTEAGTAGFYESPLSHKPIARMQLRTVGQLLRGEEFDIPRMAELTSIKRAPSATSQDVQGELPM